MFDYRVGDRAERSTAKSTGKERECGSCNKADIDMQNYTEENIQKQLVYLRDYVIRQEEIAQRQRKSIILLLVIIVVLLAIPVVYRVFVSILLASQSLF